MKKLKGNRTRLVGAAIAILAVIDGLGDILPEWARPIALGLSGALMIYLRQISNTPAGKAE